jgi:hypothetical protein
MWSWRVLAGREGRGCTSLCAEDAGDVVGRGGDLEDAHAALAAGHGTDGDVDGGDAPEQPFPRMTARRRRLERETSLGSKSGSCAGALVGVRVVGGTLPFMATPCREPARCVDSRNLEAA